MKSLVYLGLAVFAMATLSGCNKVPGETTAAAHACGPSQTVVVALGGAPRDDDARLTASFSAGSSAEVVRQIGWQLCNARDNGWIDDEFFRRELITLREDSLAAPTRGRAAAAPAASEEKAASAPAT